MSHPDELYWSNAAGVVYEPTGDGNYYVVEGFESSLPSDAIRYVPVNEDARTILGEIHNFLGRHNMIDVMAPEEADALRARIEAVLWPDGTETEQP